MLRIDSRLERCAHLCEGLAARKRNPNLERLEGPEARAQPAGSSPVFSAHAVEGDARRRPMLSPSMVCARPVARRGRNRPSRSAASNSRTSTTSDVRSSSESRSAGGADVALPCPCASPFAAGVLDDSARAHGPGAHAPRDHLREAQLERHAPTGHRHTRIIHRAPGDLPVEVRSATTLQAPVPGFFQDRELFVP